MNKTCFLVSPIGNEGSDIRIHSDNVLKYLLEPVCNDNELSLIRVDDIATTTSITADIYEQLDSSELVIVDITTLNPNVFLELGYRIAKKKPYIIIKDKDVDETYPFDISGTRILEYSLKLENLKNSKTLVDKFLKQVNYSTTRVIFDSKSDNGTTFELLHDDDGLKLL